MHRQGTDVMCAAFLIPWVIRDRIKRLEVLLPISFLKIMNYKKQKHKIFQSLFVFFSLEVKNKTIQEGIRWPVLINRSSQSIKIDVDLSIDK